MNNLWPNDCIFLSSGNISFFFWSSWTCFTKEFFWLEACFRLWRNECVLWLNECFLICDEMNGSGIKGAAPLGRAQLPGGLPPENICFQVRAGHFQNLQETSGIYFLMVLDDHGIATLGLSWNFSLAENLANLSLQDRPQSGNIITRPTSQPASQPVTYIGSLNFLGKGQVRGMKICR